MLDLIEDCKELFKTSKDFEEIENIVTGYYSAVKWSLEKEQYNSFTESQKTRLIEILVKKFVK